ncbi:MAG TPA: IclR family transcriptional regulator [Ramlibacter sp.]|uniref:IclR family transcriptional regulator n=1 Tax=Ramlibacter sp. TaxID=1917967 RepID=UPI002BA433C1|nr:IclR family transcriptional regulator [Ramlibacter sp.]HVZ44917.1 IclR family transcriptional regulator [Ramlibacter sp.]
MNTRTSRAADRPTDGTQSLRRAFRLLSALSRINRDGGSVAELAEMTGLNRTTAHRMLRCLQDEGVLRFVPRSHRYFLGPLAYEIGLAAAEQVKLRTICAPAIARIAAQTGDTVFLIERERYDGVCVDRAEGTYPVKTLVMSVGDRRPLGVGAAGLAILAAAEDADDVVEHNADRFSSFPGLTLSRLRRSLAEARQRGIVCGQAIGVPGVRAVGVALRTPTGTPIGALSIAAIETRMTDKRVAQMHELLAREAAALTRALAR